ncbi:MAB_1171c family putative transporter [Kitasatospora sp. NPDC058965]|uniref:MAB_1171c family putative transporter n=1 Tax=Kitasatospora sp. NPDC058965 TaxID=3346682 RepID=UPI00369EA5E9
MVELGSSDLAAYLSGGLCLFFAGRRLAALRLHPQDAVQRYVAGFLVCMGAALAALAPASLTRLTTLGLGEQPEILLTDALRTGAESLLVLIGLALEARDTGAAGARRLRGRIRLHQVAAPAVPVTMALLLGAAHIASRGDELVVSGSGRWLLAGYDTLFAGYAVGCLWVLVSVLGRRTRRAGPGLLRTGLRLMRAAAALGVVWSLWTVDDIAGILADGRQGGGEDTPSIVLGAACAALTVIGASATVWGRARWTVRLAGPLRRCRARRRHRALEPLWSALRSAVPGIALLADGPEPGPVRGRVPLRHAEFALYRRIIEIRDGQLALRAHLPAEAPQWVVAAVRESPVGRRRVRRPAPLGAVVEAALLAAALETRRAGTRSGGDPGAGWAPQPVPGTVAAEAAWLLQVAAAFADGPAVARVRERAALRAQGAAARSSR